MKRIKSVFSYNFMIAMLIFLILIAIGSYYSMSKKVTTNSSVVVFQVDNNDYQKVKTVDGYISEIPKAPKKEGYDFKYWQVDGKRLDDKTKIDDNALIEAVYEEKEETVINEIDQENNEKTNDDKEVETNTTNNNSLEQKKVFTVVFQDENNNVIESQNVEKGDKSTEINAPSKNGYIFDGWYIDNVKFDFNTIITQNIVLTCKWKKINEQTYVVKFNTAGGNLINDQIVKEGAKIQKPTNPKREDKYSFVEWLYNNEPYNFNNPVNSNITLQATWIKINDVSTVNMDSKNAVFSLLPSDKTNIFLKSSNSEVADVKIEKNYGYVIAKKLGAAKLGIGVLSKN